MLNLAAATDKFQLLTSAAVAVDVHASYADLSGSTVTAGKQNTAIVTATTTDILAAPAASTIRNLKFLSIRNKGAAATTVTLIFDQNGTDYEIHKATLAPNQTLIFIEGLGFDLVDHTLGLTRKISTADQVIGAAATYIAGSDLDLTGVQIGTVLKWVFCMTKTAAGVAAQTFDVRFGTAGSTADTSRVGTGSVFTTGTQTAIVDTAEVEIRCVVRGPITAACVVHGQFEFEKNAAAATGFAPQLTLVAQQTSAAFDITTSGMKAGLVTTPGASASVTIQQVIAERIDP